MRHYEIVERYVLTLHRKEGYLDFQRQYLQRKYSGETFTGDVIIQIPDHFAVNYSGSIRRIYKHYDATVAMVRSISLRNFYLLPDPTIARLVMMTSPSLDWIRDLPVNYHPVSNSDLNLMTSMDDFIAHFTGPNTVVPSRLRNVFAPADLITLVQLVPGEYLNPLSNILKHEFVPTEAPPKYEKLLMAYYRGRVKDAGSYLFRVVYSYVKTCRYLGQKLNMRLNSQQRLTDEREAAWRGRDIKLNPEIHTRRDLVIPSENYKGVSIRLINSRSALRKEGQLMRNCVGGLRL